LLRRMVRIGEGCAMPRRSVSVPLRVRQLRSQLGLSQSDLARLIGSDRRVISDLEGGGFSPTVRFLEGVAEALGVEAWELLLPAAGEDTVPKRIAYELTLLDPQRLAAAEHFVRYLVDDCRRALFRTRYGPPASHTGRHS
jgi:transcriptional regulator with XRE-family HTH domain